jgi:hypothetical protein
MEQLPVTHRRSGSGVQERPLSEFDERCKDQGPFLRLPTVVRWEWSPLLGFGFGSEGPCLTVRPQRLAPLSVVWSRQRSAHRLFGRFRIDAMASLPEAERASDVCSNVCRSTALLRITPCQTAVRW